MLKFPLHQYLMKGRLIQKHLLSYLPRRKAYPRSIIHQGVGKLVVQDFLLAKNIQEIKTLEDVLLVHWSGVKHKQFSMYAAACEASQTPLVENHA